MENTILFISIALCLLCVAIIVLLTLYIRAEKKLAKYNISAFFEEIKNDNDKTDNGEL